MRPRLRGADGGKHGAWRCEVCDCPGIFVVTVFTSVDIIEVWVVDMEAIGTDSEDWT